MCEIEIEQILSTVHNIYWNIKFLKEKFKHVPNEKIEKIISDYQNNGEFIHADLLSKAYKEY